MGVITDKFAQVWRDWVTVGLPASGANKPNKKEIRELGPLIETAIGQAALGALVSAAFETRAAMDASLAYDAGTVALVYADPLTENNNLYVKVGSSGSGFWSNTNIFVRIVLETDNAWLRFINKIDQSIMAQLNMETGLFEVIALSVRDNLIVDALAFGDDTAIQKTESVGLRITADEGGIYAQNLGAGISQTARSEPRELVARSAYIGSIFAGESERKQFASAEVNLVIYFGQSWSMGFDSVPVVSGASRFPEVLTFNGGVRQQKTVAEDPAALQSFVPGVERQAVGTAEIPGAVVGETGAISFANQVIELIRDENNIPPSGEYRLLVAAPGEGSRSIEQLCDPAGVYMARIQDIIAQAYNICQANGWTLAVPAVCWMQGAGASDETGLPGNVAEEYPQEMENGRLLVQSYIDALLPGSRPVRWITWQSLVESSNPASQASAKSLYERFVSGISPFPHIICCGPSYQYHNVGNSHVDPWSSADIGRNMAVAFKRAVLDGDEFDPLKPVSILRQGKIAVIETNLSRGSLVVDTAQVAAAANLGFSLYDGAGTPLTISEVKVSGNRVHLLAVSDIPSGAQIGYADVGTNFLRTTKWRGNIRDDNGSLLACQNNWLVAFRLPFDN